MSYDSYGMNRNCIFSRILRYVFSMVIVSTLLHAEIRWNYHREDATHFILAPGHIRPIYQDQHRTASLNMMAKKYRQAKQVQVNENGKEKSLKKAKSVTMEMMLTQRTWLYIHSNGGFSLWKDAYPIGSFHFLTVAPYFGNFCPKKCFFANFSYFYMNATYSEVIWQVKIHKSVIKNKNVEEKGLKSI